MVAFLSFLAKWTVRAGALMVLVASGLYVTLAFYGVNGGN